MTDPAQALVLSDPHSLKFLAPFVGRERSASHAASELEVSLHRMIYWVKRLQVIGLIHPSSITGRTRNYRAVADAFFVPFSATNAETGEQLLERWNRPWHDIFVTNFLRELVSLQRFPSSSPTLAYARLSDSQEPMYPLVTRDTLSVSTRIARHVYGDGAATNMGNAVSPPEPRFRSSLKRRAAAPHEVEDRSRNVVGRQREIGRTERDSGSGHTVNDAAGKVLRDRHATRVVQGL